MNVFELAAKLTLDTSEYTKGLDGAEQSASGFGSKLSSGLGTAAKVGGAALAAVGTAAVAAAGAIANGVNNLAEYGDTIDKQSQKMGMSAQAYQEWDAILQHSGTSIDAMGRGMTTLAKAAENDAAAFEALGISQEEVASMNQEELFAATIKGLQGMEEGTERTVLAQKLLGGAAKELGPLLNTSAEETEAMRKRVHELGGVLSDEAVKSSAAFEDSLQDLKTTISGAKNQLLSEFLPAATQVMDGLTDIFSGDSGGIEKIKQGVSDFISTLSERLPEFVEAGGEILSTIITGLFENLPQLLEAGWEILKILGEQLIKLAVQLLEIGWEWILQLTQGIRDKISDVVQAAQDMWQQFKSDLAARAAEALQQGIDWIVNLIQGIKNKISDTVAAGQELWQSLKTRLASFVGEILNIGVDWIVNLIQGIRNKIADTVQAGHDLIEQVKSTIRNAIANFREIGGQLMEGLKQGIVNKVQGIISAVRGAVQDAIGAAKRLLGIASPSKVFMKIGEFLDEGLAKGIERFASRPVGAVKDLADEVSGTFGASYNVNGSASGSASATSGMGQPIILQVLLDGKVIGETSYNYMKRRTRMVGA